MTTLEPAMPPIPVAPCAASGSRAEPALRQLRRETGYRGARLAIRCVFGLECVAGAATVLVVLFTRRTVSPWIASVAVAAVLTVSFVGAELASAVFDIADATVHDRLKP